MRDQFEAGDSRQFTFVCSATPDSAPYFSVFGPNDGLSLINSQTAQTSGSMAYYAMFTMPSSADGVYLGVWNAQKTVAGTAYPFVTRFEFVVARTRGED